MIVRSHVDEHAANSPRMFVDPSGENAEFYIKLNNGKEINAVVYASAQGMLESYGHKTTVEGVECFIIYTSYKG